MISTMAGISAVLVLNTATAVQTRKESVRESPRILANSALFALIRAIRGSLPTSHESFPFQFPFRAEVDQDTDFESSSFEIVQKLAFVARSERVERSVHLEVVGDFAEFCR